MNKAAHLPITYARFADLINELSVLEDLLRWFHNKEVMILDRNRDQLEPIILELIKCCAGYQRSIHAHLEECREWDIFPDAFWADAPRGSHAGKAFTEYPLKNPMPTKLVFLAEEIRRVSQTAETLLRAYQYSGYIGHSPVAIDLLDFLTEIPGQLYDMANHLSRLVASGIPLVTH